MQNIHIQEVEKIEADDNYHDFGGAHGNKGHDFAHFWMIVRLTELEKANIGDYLLLCEYTQDVAELDSSTNPTTLILYQIKKKEDGYWSPALLTGQTKTDKTKKPKADRPVVKLYRSVAAFKSIKTTAVFLSNAAFSVDLKNIKDNSVNSEEICLSEWSDEHTAPLIKSFGNLIGAHAQNLPIEAVSLKRINLSINDMQSHVNGIVFDFLRGVAPEHVAQASSLVDALYVRIKATARRTQKCTSFVELKTQRGIDRSLFTNAVVSLQSTPDKPSYRQQMLERVSGKWTLRRRARVDAAMLRLAIDRILLARKGTIPALQNELILTNGEADQADSPEAEWFEKLQMVFKKFRPELSEDDVCAYAIYEMTEWITRPTPAP